MRKIWKKEQDNMLQKIHQLYTNKELSEIMGFSKSTIMDKKKKLGIVKEKKYPEGFKKCWMCECILPLEDFYRNKTNGDGRASHCKVCDKIRKHNKTNKVLNAIKEEENKKKAKLDRYINKHKDEKLFCKACNCEKTLDDYYLYIDNKDNVHRQCKTCSKIKFKQNDIERARKKGY